MRADTERSRFALAVAAAAVVAGVGALAGCQNDDGAPTPPPDAVVEDTVRIVPGASTMGPNAYSPNPDTVQVGTRVRWINDDNTTHTVTSDTGVFNLTGIGPGQQVPRVFGSAGDFPYHCAIPGHNMQGRIVAVP